MAHTRVYKDGQLLEEGFDPARISDFLEQPDTIVWLDLCDPDHSDLALIAEEFGLHPLAVEDAVHDRQRPKLDRYDDHLFLTLYNVDLDMLSGKLVTNEVSAFVAPRYLITVRKDPAFDISPVVKAWDASKDLAPSGVAYLLYGLIDTIVDTHFDVVQGLDEQIERLEDLLFDSRPIDREVQRRSFEMRKSLVALRRVVLPMREVVNSLLRRELDIVDDRMAPYFQDVYDHVLRATEWTESLRDMVTTVIETNLTIQGNRLNEIMKKLTSWAAIIAVPTAVTGFYGQNVPYPGFNSHRGFVESVVLMVGISVALFVLFKRKNWL